VTAAGWLREGRRVVRTILRDPSNRGQRIVRLARGAGFQIRKRIVARPSTVRLFNGLLFRAYPDCHSSSLAVYVRVPYQREIAFLRSRLLGGTLIDVGGNVGLITLLLADRLDDALLFEPNPAALRRARENLELNGLPFRTFEVALSDGEGELTLEDRGGVDSENRVVDPARPSLYPTRTAPRRTLDGVLAEEPSVGTISLVKIDVEGHEEAVVRGMLVTLRERRPPLVMLEYLERTDLAAVARLFASADYRVHRLTSEGRLTPLGETTRPLQDLFAVPAEARSESGG
jgi:FkbM family methyltransferase